MWQTLPAEIRIMVLLSIQDLPTLKNFLLATPSSQHLFTRYAEERFNCILHSIPSEIREIIEKIWWSRHRVALPKYFRQRLEKPGRFYTPLIMGWEREADQLAILVSVAEMAESIDALAVRFAEQRILAPSGKIGGPVSPVEMHRIQRAFWWFQKLYVDNPRSQDSITGKKQEGKKRYFFYEEMTPSGDRDTFIGEHWLRRKSDYTPEDALYYRSMWDDGWDGLAPSDWVLPEIEAIREFVRGEVKSIQIDRYHKLSRAKRLHQQPKPIQQLIRDIDSWGTDPRHNSGSHPLIAALYSISTPGDLSFRPNPTKNANVDLYETQFMKIRQHSLKINHRWGWCIWDLERLVRCGLLPGRPRHYEPYTFCLLRPATRKEPITSFEQMKNVERSHVQCNIRLMKTLDSRIQAQFQADAAPHKQAVLRCAELKDKEQSLAWTKARDIALFEQWTRLLEQGTFGRLKQLQAGLCFKKFLIMKSLEDGSHDEENTSSEEDDLDLLVRLREYYTADKAIRNRILAFPERGDGGVTV